MHMLIRYIWLIANSHAVSLIKDASCHHRHNCSTGQPWLRVRDDDNSETITDHLYKHCCDVCPLRSF